MTRTLGVEAFEDEVQTLRERATQRRRQGGRELAPGNLWQRLVTVHGQGLIQAHPNLLELGRFPMEHRGKQRSIKPAAAAALLAK